MTLDRTARLFFDASCLFAAAVLPSGGSAYLLSVCRRGYLQAVGSMAVLLEAERYIVAKYLSETTEAYHDLIRSTSFQIVAAGSEANVLRYRADFFEDDHVVAAAMAAAAEFLITLDKRLERRIADADLSFAALSPRWFLQTILPTHHDYLTIRGDDASR